MAQISFSAIQIIVENAMRLNNYGGSIKVGSQSLNLEPSWTNTNPINYQSLRDTIARSIVDALTAASVTGSISTGNTTAPGGQDITESSTITITNNPNIALSSAAARVGDNVVATILSDPTFVTWMATISTAVSTLAGGAPILPPTSVTSTINTGSSTVNIGN